MLVKMFLNFHGQKCRLLVGIDILKVIVFRQKQNVNQWHILVFKDYLAQTESRILLELVLGRVRLLLYLSYA